LVTCGLSLELKRGNIDGFRQAIEWHVDNGGEASRGSGSSGGGKPFPLCAAGFVDVGVGVDEAGEKGNRAEVFNRNGRVELLSRFDGGNVLAIDYDYGIDFAMRRDYAARTKCMYH
jgi:hypothetical protein